MHITSELTIAAPVARVWALTIDVEGWPATTPTMTSVERLDEGPIGVGSRARVVQPRQRPTVWTVTRFEPERRFEWRTSLATVTMTAVHELEPSAEGCVNRLRVELSGFGAGVVSRLLGSKIREAIGIENEGFRTAAERHVGEPSR